MSYDPATRADKLKSLMYAVMCTGIVLTLIVAYCLDRHGMS